MRHYSAFQLDRQGMLRVGSILIAWTSGRMRQAEMLVDIFGPSYGRMIE